MSQKSGCAKCANNCPEQALDKFISIVRQNEGKILGNYVNSFTKILVQCKLGHIWETQPNAISSHKTWCPICKESHGERTVRGMLNKYNIAFTSQKEHPSLLGRKYDFYFVYNNKEFYLEFDDEQHFTRNDFFCKTEEDYQYRRNVDVLKSDTVVKNNGYLIRLDYTLTEEQMESHILTAINGNNKLYLSNATMYEWIITGVNQQPIPIELNIRVSANAIIPRISLTLNIIKS